MTGTVKVRIKGVVPILFCSVQLANPMNPIVKAMKAITNKPSKKRTEDDLLEHQRLEWYGGIISDEKKRVVVPGEYIETMVQDGAKATREGKDAQIGVSCDSPNYLLGYDGPKNIDELWESGRFIDVRAVRVGTAKVMRTRPRFNTPWHLDFTLFIDGPNKDDVRKWIETAGQMKGLGDYRPKFGRFEVERFS